MGGDNYERTRRFLEENPPSKHALHCELCGRQPLVTISHKDRYGLPLRFRICPFCSLLTLNPRWNGDLYAVFYREYYRPLVAEYNLRVKKKKEPDPHEESEEMKNKVTALIGAFSLPEMLPAEPKILEIGGGRGDAAEALRDALHARVVVIEPNDAEAAVARSKGFEVDNTVLEHSDLEPESFDLIVMLRTVDHLVDCGASFRKMHRCLRAGGKVLLDAVDYFKRTAEYSDPVRFLKLDHCYYFSLSTLVAMLAKHGIAPVIADLNFSNQIAVLAERADPGAGMENPRDWLFPEGARRFAEWEKIARRPGARKIMRSEAEQLLSRARKKLGL